MITNKTSRKALISIMTSACPIGQLEADVRPLKPASRNKVLGTNGEGKTSTGTFGINFISKGPYFYNCSMQIFSEPPAGHGEAVSIT
jgi:hypothetical protein